MIVSLTILTYRRLYIPVAVLAMAVHRIPLRFTKGCSFWKLMGCGKNGTFDLKPDWQQWGLLAVWDTEADFQRFYKKSFVSKWWNRFARERLTVLCEPLSSHGKWTGKEPFKNDSPDENYDGPVAVLTRATIRFNRLTNFWANVGAIAELMNKAPGYITSYGIGEAPFYLQATFSVWESLEHVKNFAYRSKEHSKVIEKTRKENWYSEELFARFKPLASMGTLNGINPFAGTAIPVTDEP